MNDIRPRSETPRPVVEILTSVPDPAPVPAPDRDQRRPLPTRVRVPDRRVSARHKATNGRGWAGWYEGAAFRESAAWVLDISASGCLLATDAPPPEGCSVWIRVASRSHPDWAEARLVARLPSRAGIFASRMVFRGAGPYGLIRAVAFEADLAGQAGPDPPSWEPNSW